MLYCTFLSDGEQCLGFLYVKNVLVKGQLGVEAGVWVLYTNKGYVLFKQPLRQATLVEIIMINTQFKIVWQVYHQIHCTWVKLASLSATSPDDNMGKINVSTKKGVVVVGGGQVTKTLKKSWKLKYALQFSVMNKQI